MAVRCGSGLGHRGAARASAASASMLPAGRRRAEDLLREPERHAAERVQRPVREVVGEAGADQRAEDRRRSSAYTPAGMVGREPSSPGAHGWRSMTVARREEPLPQPRAPVRRARLRVADRGVDLGEDGLDEAVEQGLLAGQVVVERHGLDAEIGGEAAHRQRREPVRVGESDRRGEHALAAERLPRSTATLVLLPPSTLPLTLHGMVTLRGKADPAWRSTMHPLIRTARTTGLLYLGLAITGHARLPAHPVAPVRRRRPRARPSPTWSTTSRSPAPGSPSSCSSCSPRRWPPCGSTACSGGGPVRRRRHRRVRPRQRGRDPRQRGHARDRGRGRRRRRARSGGDAAATVQLLYLDQRQPVGRRRAVLRPVAHPHGVVRAALRLDARARSAGSSSSAASATCSARSSPTSSPTSDAVADLLVVPATIGEFWMIGYLLVRGVRPIAGGSRASRSPSAGA